MASHNPETAERPFSAIQTLLLFVAIAGIVFAISRFALMRSPRSAGAQHPAVGKAAPPIEFAPLTANQPIRLAEESGNVVLINFWGTWCPPCRIEFPKLVQITRPYLARDDFKLISVCVPGDVETQEELASDAAAFLKQQNADFPAVADPDSMAFAALLEVVRPRQSGVPFTLVIDRQGKIAGVWVGYETGDEEEVAQVLRVALDAAAANTNSP